MASVMEKEIEEEKLLWKGQGEQVLLKQKGKLGRRLYKEK
jgi:hypothetical protein